MNDLYRNPPASTEQTIHPRLYPNESLDRVAISKQSANGRTRMTPANQANYETWGEAALFTMFVYPYFESNGEVTIVSAKAFRTSQNGSFDLYNYTYRGSAGWDGDRLIGYRNGDGEYA